MCAILLTVMATGVGTGYVWIQWGIQVFDHLLDLFVSLPAFKEMNML